LVLAALGSQNDVKVSPTVRFVGDPETVI